MGSGDRAARSAAGVPVSGVLWLAEQILEQAEDQYYDPVRIRAQLERVDEARRTGELSEEECDESRTTCCSG